MLHGVRRLLDYNDWANRRALASIESLNGNQDEDARRALGHVLMAETAWHARLTGGDAGRPELFPLHSLAELLAKIDALKALWSSYLAGMDDAKIAGEMEYKTFKGDVFRSSIMDIITHVVNHGSYHRGQVAKAARVGGGEPLATDFIMFAREV